MKCLFVHDLRSYYFENEEYTTNFSYEIIKTRYLCHFNEFHILNRTEKVNGPLSDKFVLSNGPGVFFVNKIDMFSGVDFFLKKEKYSRIISQEVKNADFIIVRLDSFLGLIALRYCEKYSKKYLIEVAGCVWDSFWNKGLLGKALAPGLFQAMRRAIKKAPNVIYVTTEFLQNRYPTKGKNIACSNVMLNDYDFEFIKKKRMERIDEKYKKINIATIAAVDVPYKNQEAVIIALGKLRNNKCFIYNIVGGGNNDRLKKIAKKNGVSEIVRFYGSMNHAQIFDLLDETDIYIQPSKQEGLPRALIEAMSRGCVCYGSQVAGIPELLQSDYVFSIRNANKKIVRLIENYNKNIAKEQAVRNIDESKKYRNDILEQCRYDFIENAINE